MGLASSVKVNRTVDASALLRERDELLAEVQALKQELAEVEGGKDAAQEESPAAQLRGEMSAWEVSMCGMVLLQAVVVCASVLSGKV